MTRPKVGRVPLSRDRPVLVFEGAHGSGKTALLGMLVGKLDQHVPHALVNLEETPTTTSVPDVLSALAFDLGSRCPRYGELRFPRFIIGRLVMREQLDLDNRPRACRQVVALLEKERNVDKLREVLVQTAGGLLDEVDLPIPVPVRWLGPLGRHLPGLVLNLLVKWAPGRRIVLGRFHEWYGSRGRGLTNDPIDKLVDLNRWGLDPKDEDNRQRIEELLLDAFLTDLREGFRRSRHAGELAYNCAALLDNADTELGQRFLYGLVMARRQRAAEGKLAPDPLTVLATSRGAVLAGLPAAGTADLSPWTPGSAVPGDSANDTRHWWARYRLAHECDYVETRSMITALALPDGNTDRLTLAVHELTGGHPASTRLLVDAVAHRPARRDDLASLLDQPEPGVGPNMLRVGERMRRRLLDEFPDDVFEDLVTCAAARNPHDAARLAEHSTLLDCGEANYQLIEEALWPVTGGAGPTLLRRLLLRLLSRRPEGDQRSWPKVFSWLRGHCKQGTGELYYALADGDLAFVTGRMRDRLARDELAGWPEVLDEVASAPRRQPAEGAEVPAPIDQMRALLRASTTPGQPIEPLSRLIASMWIVHDPLTDSRRATLHRQLHDDWRDIAKSLPDDDDRDLLRGRATDHSGKARLWK
ncbi:MAG: hypothetical protein ACR2G2_15515 [Pseudonocardia sp.]